jgi:hypothetical protein
MGVDALPAFNRLFFAYPARFARFDADQERAARLL